MATPIGVFHENSKESLRSRKSESRRDIVKKHGDLVRITQLEGKGKFSYDFGEKYPGLIVGHEKCKDGENGGLVPKYMGWLWNIETVGIKNVRKGWCPGAIPEAVKDIMQSFLNPCPFKTLIAVDEVDAIKCEQNENKNADGKSSRRSSSESKRVSIDLSLNKVIPSGVIRCERKSVQDMETQYENSDFEGEDGAKKSISDGVNKSRSKSSPDPQKIELDNQRKTFDKSRKTIAGSDKTG